MHKTLGYASLSPVFSKRHHRPSNIDCREQLQPEYFSLSTPTRKTKANALADLLIAPRFLKFMQKFEVVQGAQGSWLRKPQPCFFCSAITGQATLIPTSNSNQNAFNSKNKTEAFLLESETLIFTSPHKIYRPFA